MRFINKKFMLFMTNVFLLAGIGSTIANYSTSVIQGEAQLPTIFDQKTIGITVSDFTNSTSNLTFTITKGTGNEQFIYTGNSNRNSTDGTWVQLKSNDAQLFKQDSASGSLSNKWRLTSITMKYTKVGTTTEDNVVTLNGITLFSWRNVTTSTSVTNLNLNRETQTKNFNFIDNISTFSIDSTYVYWIEELSLTYTIDYSDC